MNIPKLIGPQIYGSAKNSNTVSINIDLSFIRTNRILNFTGYAYVDQTYKFATNILTTKKSLLVIHDNDYLGFDGYAELLKENNHTVCFVLAPKEWTTKNMGDRTNTVFGGCPASNSRIRKAHDKLKSLGVKVKKFQNPLALEKYLIKQVKAV